MAGDRSPALLRLQKRPLLKLIECLAELRLIVHYDRPVPGDRFLQRLAGDEEEAYSVRPGLHNDFVAAIEEHERSVARFFGRSCVQPADRFGRHG